MTDLYFDSHDKARAAFNAVADALEASGSVSKIWRSPGLESITFDDGTVLRFRTRTTRLPADAKSIIDEAIAKLREALRDGTGPHRHDR